MNIAYIMRGVPGSGKSTKARRLAGTTGAIHSTDSYFYIDGVYFFEPERLLEYHQQNFEAFKASLAAGVPIVICDNTNGQRQNFVHYVAAAEAAGYQVKIVTLPHPDPATAARRSKHDVPAAIVQQMIDQWEE